MEASDAEVRRLRQQLEVSEREVARIAQLEHDLQHARRQAEIALAERDRLAAELEQAGDLRGRLERSEQLVRDLQASPSWRVTRPLRSAKRLLG